jgi:PAS domain S-box-containing protein
MTSQVANVEALTQERDALRARLEEAEDALRAIRAGEVDAVAIYGPAGPQVYTLKGADHTYRLLVEGMKEGAVVLTMDGTILFSNEYFAVMVGTPLEQIMGVAIDSLLRPAEEASLLAWLQRQQVHAGHEEITLRRRDGLLIPAYVGVQSLKQEETEVLCLVVTDLTELKQTENRLRQANRALHAMSRCNQAIIHAADEYEMLHMICRVVVEAGGYRLCWIGYPEPGPGKGIRPVARAALPGDLLDKIDFMDAATGGKPVTAVSAMETGRPVRSKEVVLPVELFARAPGSPENNRAWILAVPLASASGVLGVMSIYAARADAFPEEEVKLLQELAGDVGYGLEVLRTRAGRDRAEQALQRAHDRLEIEVQARTAQMEIALKDLESFAYSVAHDLRAPLRAVDGFAQLLLKEYAANLPEKAQHYLEMVGQNARQMGRLIDDLLRFSRLSRQPLSRQTVDMADMVRHCLDELKAEQEERHVEVTIGDLATCEGDPALLKQLWLNLLSNALKFTRGRDPARIEVERSVQDGEVVYRVRDNGVGFDMRYTDKLFGVFQRLHSAEEFEGTGVGLAIVHRIVRRHGGRIWAEAKPNEGATFFFTVTGVPNNRNEQEPTK